MSLRATTGDRTMSTRLKVLVGFVSVYLATAGVAWALDHASVAGGMLFPVYVLALLLSTFMPGMLQNNGMCGHGWCAPSVFGWVFAGVVSIAIVWGFIFVVDLFVSAVKARRSRSVR